MSPTVRSETVSVAGLSRSFGVTRALQDVDLTLHRGSTGLLGPNGAGKTTLHVGVTRGGEAVRAGYRCRTRHWAGVGVRPGSPRPTQRVEIRRRLGRSNPRGVRGGRL